MILRTLGEQASSARNSAAIIPNTRTGAETNENAQINLLQELIKREGITPRE